MMKCLVTGSTGFVGARLIGLLNTIEVDIKLLARSKVDNYETIICDLGQDRIPKYALESIDTVFHLAGFAHDMQDSSKVVNLYRVINVNATVELARLAVGSGVKRFIFISSVKAGGKGEAGRYLNEHDQGDPQGVYGKTKREAELKLLKIGKESGMHVSIIRPSLVYGPGVKGNLQSMLMGVKNGWFPPLPETGNQRSMIHVDDLVRAILLVSQDERARGGVFIATDGKSYSSREIYSTMCNILGRPVPKWSMPKLLFTMVAMISLKISYKVEKLLGDEFYSSKGLEALGFKAQRRLKEMNETDF